MTTVTQHALLRKPLYCISHLFLLVSHVTLGQGGKHTLYEKNESSPFVYLQSEVLTAFCTLTSCASILIRPIEPEIVRYIY